MFTRTTTDYRGRTRACSGRTSITAVPWRGTILSPTTRAIRSGGDITCYRLVCGTFWINMKRLRHFKWQRANGKWQRCFVHLIFALCLLPLAMLLAVSPAHATYSNGYSNLETITIPAQTSNTSTLSNFPMLLSGTYFQLSTVTASGGVVVSTNGYDIIF